MPFSIALVSDDEATEFGRHQTLFPLIFERQIPFASSTLPKVAAAFEPEISTLAVKWQPSSDDLIVWGVFPHQRRARRFSELSCGVSGQAPYRRDCFTAISRGRGSFAIARGDSLIGSFQAGYFVAASPTVLTAKSLGDHLITLINQDTLFQAHGNYYWHEVRDAVELLIREAAYRGRGGTFVLLPSGSNSAATPYEVNCVLRDSYGLRTPLGRCLSERSSENSDESGVKASALRQVDELETITYGAKLTASPSTATPLTGADGWGANEGKPFDLHRYGMRHRSAFDFVATCPGSIAFVISQDGPVRAFRRMSPGVVQVWPDCNASMFL